MKKFGKYFVLLALALLTIGVLVTTSIVYTARAATNLPTKTTVESIALTTKTVQLFTNQVINQGQTLYSSFVSTQGYKRAAVYISEVNGATGMNESGQFSPDGINGYDDGFALNGLWAASGQTIYEMTPGNVDGPMFRVKISNGVDSSYPPSATFSVTLYLMP
jgi:hypothetical protein